jgi:hypothetical protein
MSMFEVKHVQVKVSEIFNLGCAEKVDNDCDTSVMTKWIRSSETGLLMDWDNLHALIDLGRPGPKKGQEFESIELNFHSVDSNKIFIVKNEYGIMGEKYVLYSNLCSNLVFVPRFDADTYLKTIHSRQS